MLEQHRAAIPKRGWLKIVHPTVSEGENTALFPRQTAPVAEGVNSLIDGYLDLLELLVDQEPDSYDKARKTFHWGPFPNEFNVVPGDAFWVRIRRHGGARGALDAGLVEAGVLADAVLEDVPPEEGGPLGPQDAGADLAWRPSGLDAAAADAAAAGDAGDQVTTIDQTFEYVIELVQGLEDDRDARFTLLWIGSSPQDDEGGYGEGVVIWDFEAAYDWDLLHNPVVMRTERGRVALSYVAQQVSDREGSLDRTVLGSFRSFLSRDAAPGTPAADFDALWGGVRNGSRRYDYLRFASMVDLDPGGETAPELVQGTMSVLPGGAGRVEAVAVMGDVPTGFHAVIVECWDAKVERQHFQAVLLHDLGMMPPMPMGEEEGENADCYVSRLDPTRDVTRLPESLRRIQDYGAERGIERLAGDL